MTISEGIRIEPVDSGNWRDIYPLEVNEDQKDFVNDPGYYLCLCAYGDDWHPMAIYSGRTPVGFLMWAIDEDDNSCWFGGIIIDKAHQRHGYGRKAIELAILLLGKEQKPDSFALSYAPENRARALYQSLGFVETGEMEDEELVARYRPSVSEER